jgi:hypothetical protein
VQPRSSLKTKAAQNKTLSALVAGFLINSTLAAFSSSLPEYNHYFSYPLMRFLAWEPKGTVGQWVYLWGCYLIYSGLFWGIRDVVLRVWSRRKKEQTILTPRIIYADEIAATIIMAEKDGDKPATKKQIIKLLKNMADSMAACFGLSSREYRATIVVSDEENAPDLSAIRTGRKLREKQRDLSIEMDALHILYRHSDETHTHWTNAKEQFPHGDVEHFVFVRNPGDIRLGCLIAILRKDVDIEGCWSEFLQVSYPFTLLGYVDKIVESVVRYKVEGDNEDGH